LSHRVLGGHRGIKVTVVSDATAVYVPYAALGVGEDEVELAGALQHLERTGAAEFRKAWPVILGS